MSRDKNIRDSRPLFTARVAFVHGEPRRQILWAFDQNVVVHCMNGILLQDYHGKMTELRLAAFGRRDKG